MRHPVATLEGALLDAAVALCEGAAVWPGRIEWPDRLLDFVYRPSESWADGGPIIERERIRLDAGDEDWTAYSPMDPKLGFASGDGPTALIAAMRAHVASKFGAEVDLP